MLEDAPSGLSICFQQSFTNEIINCIGYPEAVHVLNSYPQDLLVELVGDVLRFGYSMVQANDVIDFLTYKVGAISEDQFYQVRKLRYLRLTW